MNVCKDKGHTIFFKTPTPGTSKEVAILKTHGTRKQGDGDSEKEAAFVKALTVSDKITKAEILKAMQVALF